MDLGETVGKNLIFCNVPQQWHHQLGLCVVLLARVEHNFVVGVDLVKLLAATSLILLQRYCEMKRPGPTLRVRLRETGFSVASTRCLDELIDGSW